MRRLAVLMLATAVVLVPAGAEARSPVFVRGAGTGTFDADIDGDGRIDGSQFGFAVWISEGGAARGHFLCLMAGRSQILGLRIMSVSGHVTGGEVVGGSVTFTGTATVSLGGGTAFHGVGFQVTASPGGSGEGTLQLTVMGAFDGVPGDASPGNGNYDLPVETVRSGQISM